ncbi:uncharacterized protein LOC130050613 [Ostrea edulis]|uniref:uncharacterized protein LOC130050613 n=1 Tax=Ostrea edulis TaxID=37623 RepID=UPI0024AF80EC|nr:uncharacterized protein LOC130050613 [Ostrea edulis]
MEHIIHSNIISHLEKNNVLSTYQHGFRKKRSCQSQLIITIQELAEALNSGEQMDCILLDFSKAFVKMPHQRLLNKCQYYRIRGNTLIGLSASYKAEHNRYFWMGGSQKHLKSPQACPKEL